jgi:hypothetical protein
MRSKLMIMSAAALLAGTMLAAGQTTPGKGMQGPAAGGGQENGQTNSAKPSGQAQDLQKGRAQGGPQVQDKSRNETQRDVSRPTTNGQAPRGDEDRSQSQPQNQRDRADKTPDKAQRGDQERTQGQSTRDKDAQGQNQPQKGDTQKGDTQRQGETEHQGGGNTTVNLTTEQRTKIRETVLTGSNAPRVSNVTFAVNVGTVIPRTVTVVEVPEPLIEIHPEWRGFRYFVYNDEIIVVEPDSLRIVAVVIV